MTIPHTHFNHCPSCGEAVRDVSEKRMQCGACGFLYFFNPTIGLAGFIENERGEILLIERGKEPAKGKLAPPGGFADINESAEQSLSREVFEETGLQVVDWTYLCSAVNNYAYASVTYPVLDFFYTAQVSDNQDLNLCPEETVGAKWFNKHSIQSEELAFPSMREAFGKLLEKF
ncbi:MAG: NUDIX domain-containing protein [Puniceicoccaceae bacterium]